MGFLPHCFAALKRWPIAPTIIEDNPRVALNQVLEADLVYIRDLARLETLSDDKLKHLALLMHHCYGSVDVAGRVLLELDRRAGRRSELYDAYLKLVSEDA